MPETAFDEEFENGVLKKRTPRVVSDAEIERRNAGEDMRDRLPALRQWAGDAQDAAALTAMTAAQRIQRQAVIETRVAALSRLCVRLIWKVDVDDGK